jgi:hypothetical protein
LDFLDFFWTFRKLLGNFLIFFGNFSEAFFWRNFLAEFFERKFLGGFFSEDIFGGLLGGSLCLYWN